METLSREGRFSWPAFKRSNCRTVENHILFIAWDFLARATSTALAPRIHPSVDVSLPERKGSANHTLSAEVPSKLLDPTLYSSYWKLLRVTAWSLRFRQIALRRDGRSGNLTALELEATRSYWIQDVQGEYFAAELKALRENMPLPNGSK